MAELTTEHIVVLFSTTCYKNIVYTRPSLYFELVLLLAMFPLLTTCQIFSELFYKQQDINLLPLQFNVNAVTEYLLLGRVYFNFLYAIE